MNLEHDLTPVGQNKLDIKKDLSSKFEKTRFFPA